MGNGMSAGMSQESNANLDHAKTVAKSQVIECALAHRENGRYKEAAIFLQNWLVGNSQDASVYALLAQVLSQDKQDEAAWAALNHAMTINPALPIVQRNHARRLLKQQEPQKALQAAQAAYQSDTTDPENQLVLASAMGINNQSGLALSLVENALKIRPNYAEAFATRALLKLRDNDLAGALADAEKALNLKPHMGHLWGMVGSLRYQYKNLPGAIDALAKALDYEPDNGSAWATLASAFQDAKRLTEAKTAYAHALEIVPTHAEIANNLGALSKEEGNWEEALRYFNQALRINPSLADTHYNQGIVRQRLNRPDEAEASYRRVLVINPNHAEATYNLSVILQRLGRLSEAEASYRQALAIKPGIAEACNNLGITLQALGRLPEAEANYQRALQLQPAYAEAHSNLGSTMKDLKLLSGAVESCRRALVIKPDYADAHINLGSALQQDTGQLDNAVTIYRRALQINPDCADAHSNLLFCLSHHEAVDAQTLLAEHCRFAEQFEAPLRANWPQHTNARNPERCLEVGFVSADLHKHAVAHFIEPVLAHLTGHPHLSLHAYYNYPIEDSVTQRLKKYLKHWHPIASLSDDVLAQKVRTDGIDILIDLSGHTAKHRLLTFSRKPAPVQVSWLGYPGTTGLKAMDYYLADRFFLPPGEFENQFTEKIVRLPASISFLPFDSAPPVNSLPALCNGYLTFGSFNRLSKLNPAVIALWSQLLRALPNARMLLGAMPQAGENNTLVEWFAQEGISRERLSFHSRCQMKDYLELHNQVDLCLDTFPYNGGTTTNQALWMGVPSLTMAGRTGPSRVGTTFLSHVKLDAFIAHNKTEFIEKGLYWAGHLAELANIRDGLRLRFGQSIMAQPDVIAESIDCALRTMWQRWCAGLPVQSFEVPQLGMNLTMHGSNK